MAEILSGAAVAAALNASTVEKVSILKQKGIVPRLCIVRVGERQDDLSYERSAIKRCTAVGIEAIQVLLPDTITTDELIDCISELNADNKVHGILLFRPLPKHIDEGRACNTLNPKKDMDGITDIAMAGVYSQRALGYPPCTAQAVMELLSYYNIGLEGKNTVIIGRSLVIGKPVAMMAIKKNATVTLCHTRTRNLRDICHNADIIIAAAGRAGMVDASYVREGQVVIDVGINWNEKLNRICGDVDFDSVAPIVAAITPVPGGVGGVTTSVLAAHIAAAALE